jgi:signal peptidase I
MSPAIQPGDCILEEGFSLWWHPPRRGDIVVFRGDGLRSVAPDQFFVQRVVGEPGDQLEIAGGKLLINGSSVSLSNVAGEIHYQALGPVKSTNLPAGWYFLLGDNTANSMDSRYFGPVARQAIVGRVNYRYGPLGRSGRVK